MTNVHLHDVMQIGISKMEPKVNFLMEQGWPKFHSNRIGLGYFCCIMFSFVLVMVDIFECFGHRNTLYL
jgi:hypothetical protein